MPGISRPMTPSTEDERRKAIDAFLAGFFDMGGITSEAAAATGRQDNADALRGAIYDDPVSASIGSAANPASLGGFIATGAKGLFDAGKEWWNGTGDEPPKLMSKDEFIQARRSKRQTIEEALNAADAAARSSPSYQQAIADGRRTTAQRLVDSARKDAETTWQKSQASMPAEEAKLNSDYETYRKGFDKQLEEYHGRDFQDRNPGLSKALPVLGTVAAGVLTKGLFNRIASKGKGFADAAETAWKEGRVGDYQRASNNLKEWDAGRGGLLGKESQAIAAGAAVPLEVRGIEDAVDRFGLSREYQDSNGDWKRSRAQQSAEERTSHPLDWLRDNALGVVSGVTGAYAGSKLAKQGPAIEAAQAGDVVNTAKMQELVQARIAEQQAQAAIKASRRPAAPSPAPAATMPNAPSGVQALPPAGPQAGQPVQMPTRQPQPSAGPAMPPPSRGYDEALDRPISQDVLRSMLAADGPLPQVSELTDMIRTRLPGPSVQPRSVQPRAQRTMTELEKRKRLGVNVNDPAVRDELIRQITGGGALLGMGAVAAGGYPTREDMLKELGLGG